jgi:RNA polymerase-binding transcription factor DksA
MPHHPTQADTARQTLTARKREIYGRLVKIERDLDQPVNADAPERATERENDEVLEGLGLAGQEEIRAIDAALDRIAAGTYGICAQCGASIVPERLEVLPHTPLCQDCAAAH